MEKIVYIKSPDGTVFQRVHESIAKNLEDNHSWVECTRAEWLNSFPEEAREAIKANPDYMTEEELHNYEVAKQMQEQAAEQTAAETAAAEAPATPVAGSDEATGEAAAE